ncbi:MAG: TPM domain-containing protein [Ignavibacteria bacterium]
MKHSLLHKFLNDDDMLRISNKIGDMEKLTSGEIRVSVKEKRTLFNRNKPINELAKQEFFRLKMANTRDRTGILIFLILRDRQFYILADSGINEKADEDTWHKVKDEMQEKFRSGSFADGILTGIERVGSILSVHFPRKDDDTNELPNDVVF